MKQGKQMCDSVYIQSILFSFMTQTHIEILTEK